MDLVFVFFFTSGDSKLPLFAGLINIYIYMYIRSQQKKNHSYSYLCFYLELICFSFLGFAWKPFRNEEKALRLLASILFHLITCQYFFNYKRPLTSWRSDLIFGLPIKRLTFTWIKIVIICFYQKKKRGLQSCKNQFIIKSFVYTKLQKFFCFSMSKLCTCVPHRYLTCFVVGCLWSWKGVLNNNLLDSSRREMIRVPFLTLFWYTL